MQETDCTLLDWKKRARISANCEVMFSNCKEGGR
jgi:hypothetical protein